MADNQTFVDLDASISINSLNALLGPYARIGPGDVTDINNPDASRLEIIEITNGEFRAPFFDSGNLDKTVSRP